MIYVIDLRHYLDANGDPGAGRAAALARLYGRIAAAAATRHRGVTFLTAIPCNRRPGRRPCPGRLGVLRHPDDCVEWRCSTCDFQGYIRGWRGTPWDVVGRAASAGDESTRELYITEDEYQAVIDLDLSTPDVRAAVCGGALTLQGVQILGSVGTLTRIAREAWEVVAVEKNRRRLLLLDHVAAQIEDMLGGI
ncbi:MAG: hypothetical protein IT208_04875 [Chthonomonadales bacterium]|nr:hypothetical protein [Chthonomonadales bacterium]